MGTSTTFSGGLAIEPPLTWPEIQRSPSWPGHPNFRDRGFRADFYGAHLHVTEESVETDEGTLVRRTCDLVTIEGDELRAEAVLNSLRRLAADFGADHKFIGHFVADSNYPEDVPYRVRIVGREVIENHPVLFYPGDEYAEKIIANILLNAVGGEVGECTKLAERILQGLADRLTRK